jgi:hypothetical protein
MPGADASKLRRGAGERKSPQSAPDSLAAFERTKRSWAAELNRSSVATPSVLPAAPERAAGIAQVEDGPAGLRRPAGPSTSEGRGEAEIKMRNGCVASGRVKSDGLDFLLRGHEGSTAKPSQRFDSTPVERKVQGRRQARGLT